MEFPVKISFFVNPMNHGFMSTMNFPMYLYKSTQRKSYVKTQWIYTYRSPDICLVAEVTRQGIGSVIFHGLTDCSDVEVSEAMAITGEF